MSGIFLSHSSGDNAAAAEIKEWLVSQGHRSVFLDFDPEAGIPAGRSWEQELYQQLRTCRAVIVICSARSMASRWCFAEITHARAMGKPIFPLLVETCDVDAVLTDRQIIDMLVDKEDGYRRLARGLSLCGIDATDPFDWDGRRPPYPGLLTYNEADAAVFFGRDKEIGESLEQLNKIRRFGGVGMLLMLGGSGSGKSSLMRAGMLPRLRRDPDQWLVVDPFRPGEEPLDNLALAVAARYQRSGKSRSWREIRADLLVSIERGEEPLWENVLRDLRQAEGRPEATVLVFIDQFEELLGHAAGHPANRFLEHLRSALDPPRRSVLVVATMRSDYLGTLQKNAALQGLPFETLSVGPVQVDGLSDIIQKPAALAGMDLEQSLVQTLLADTEAEDALPLLAFTLRELYELAVADRCGMGMRDYRDRLGGLHGSVAKAAESVVTSERLPEEDEAELRGIFLGMVRIDEDGHFARRALGWQQLSDKAHAWLDRFVKARLVVARGDEASRTVEVAHEALFRAWDRLASWLEENREALALQREMNLAARQWEQAGRSDDDLWRGTRLQRALELLDTTLVPQDSAGSRSSGGGRLPLANDAVDFLQASEIVDRRTRRRRRRRRNVVLAASLLVALVTSSLFVVAQNQRNLARTRALAVESSLNQDDHLDLALLLALEVGRRGDYFESRRLLWEGLESSPGLETLLRGHEGDVRAVAWSPDGLLLASAAVGEPTVLLWDIATDSPAGRALPSGGTGVWGLDFSPDGHWLAAGAADGAVLLWATEGPPAEPRRLITEARPANEIYAVRFSPDSRWLAAARSDRSVELWNVATGRPADAMLQGSQDQLRAVAWSPDGRIVAAAGMEAGMAGRDARSVRLWDAATGAAIEMPLDGHSEGVMSLDWSPNGHYLASGSMDSSVGLWDLVPDRAPQARQHQRVYPQVGQVTSLVWGSDSSSLAMAGNDGRIAFWEVGDIRRRQPVAAPARGQAASLLSITRSPDDRWLASGSGPVVALWRADPGPRLGTLLQLEAIEVRRAASSPDGDTLAVVAKDPVSQTPGLRLWNTRSAVPLLAMRGIGQSTPEIAWSDDGTFLYAATADRTVRRMEVSSGRILDEWQAELEQGAGLRQLAWGDGGRRLAAADRDGRVELWDTERREMLAPPEDVSEARVSALAWSAGGSRLAAGDSSGILRLWDGVTGRLASGQPAGHAEQVTSLAWNSDGSVLASGSSDRTVRLWDAETGAAAGEPLDGHSAAVTHLAWSPDGATLAAATLDRQILLWDVARREIYAGPLLGHDDTITALFFNPAGTVLTSVDIDGTLRHWDVDARSWNNRVCALARRNLTDEERRQYMPWAEPAEICKKDARTNQWGYGL